MGADEDEFVDGVVRGGERVVDVRAAQGVMIGAGNTQIIYNYRGTWSEGVAPAPLIDVSGDVESPYRGLGRFTERDAPFFFGRDAAIESVLQRLSRQMSQPGLLMVSGVSGAGKSSLLRAGVLPRVRGAGLPGTPEARDWPCLLLAPGHTPLDELALATAQVAGLDAVTVRRELRRDPAAFALTVAQATATASGSGGGHDRRLLLVVDQFEQLFTQCPDDAQRRAMITALHAAATIAHGESQRAAAVVVLVVRADFEVRCADYEQLTDAIQDRFLVTAMTERQLRLAITEPAKQVGSRVDDDLTAGLIDETLHRTTDSAFTSNGVVSGAGVLPLLSYALDRAWRTRAGDTLTAADYERTGGIERAVAESAQRAYDSLTPSQRMIARQVFTRLAVTGSDGTDTADRVPRPDLTPAGDPVGDVDAVLEAFAAERLLTLAAGTVEVSHEIVFTAWPLLRDTWLAETHDSRVVCTRLRAAAAEWDLHDRDPAYLYSGSVLDTAAATADRISAEPWRYPHLGDSETQFLAAGIRAQRRRTRQRRALQGLLVVLVVALTVATVVAVQASRSSARQRDAAVARELISRSERLATTDPLGSRYSALAAWRIDPTSESRYAMLTAARNPLSAIITGHTGAIGSLTLSHDGRTLAFPTIDDGVQLWDTTTRRPLGDPFPAPSGVYEMAFSVDGATLTIVGGSGNARLWDTAKRQPIGDPLIDAGTSTLAVSPDGRTVATRDDNGIVRLWDVASHQQVGDPITSTPAVRWGTFSPDGTTFATNDANTMQLWDTTTGHPVHDPRPGVGGTLIAQAINRDGTTLARIYDDKTLRLWDTETGREAGSLRDIPSVATVAFSPDGEIIAIGGGDGIVRLWDTATLQPLGDPLTGHTSAIRTLVFTPDGNTIATGSGDGTVRLWDLTARQPIQRAPLAESSATTTAAFSPDGTILATADSIVSREDPGAVRLWDTATRQQIGEPMRTPAGDVTSMAFSPDGTTVTAAGEDHLLQAWDIRNRRQIAVPISVDSGTIRSVAYSRDGNSFATGSFDGNVRLWDIASHRQIGNPWKPTGGTGPMVFGHDGTTLLAGNGRTIRVWDTRSHQTTGADLTLPSNSDVLDMALSPDGNTLAVAANDDTIQLWDMTTRRAISTPISAHAGGTTAMPLTTVGFGPEGRTLLTFDPERAIKTWDTSATADPAAALCSWADGSFTQDQWTTRVPDGPAYRKLCP
ncbi:nSTAND1 domain-containing NTPase [Nocardia mexicana]|uniref:WD40 repeat protein n=1 Tax=Nocardia mexicana TaxID=279262 RepID=A0A370GIC2_9NOCA|nr:hypothetical protein [Nocardia mexicana]RDI43545.1 WD40 repeat protein [Nocardia mexicana]